MTQSVHDPIPNQYLSATTVRLETLEPGSVIVWAGRFWLVSDTSSRCQRYCVRLDSGTLSALPDSTQVVVYDQILVI